MVHKNLFDRQGRPIQRNIPEWIFGEPSLSAQRNADAVWARGYVIETHLKGSTGWVANLYGGLQTGDDRASVIIPVNERPVTKLNSAKWAYYMSATETMGINIVIWVHDPTDHDNRAEITQLGGHADLEKASGQNAFEFSPSTGGMFFYGEGTTGTGLTAGTQYTWLQFQQDALFKDWVIYRITLEYGWEASGTFDDAWLEDVVIEGVPIPLKPDSGGSGRIGRRHFTIASGDLIGTLAPKTPFRLLTCDLHVSATPNAGENFTITKDAGQGELYDTVIFSSDLGALSLTSLYKTFEGMAMFSQDDELDIFHDNSQNDDYGVTLTYQTVF